MKTIMHNSVSLDGSFINFDVDMGLHYQLASRFKADAHLIGSETVRAGGELYGIPSQGNSRKITITQIVKRSLDVSSSV